MFSCEENITNPLDENITDSSFTTISELNEFLIGYWSFDDTSLTDLSSNHNDGLIYGAEIDTGIIGTALNFNGYNDFAVIPHHEIYEIQEKTICFWFYKNNDFILETHGGNDVEGILGKAYDTGYNRDFTFALSNQSPPFDVYACVGLGADTLVFPGSVMSILPMEWNHCSLVIDSTEIVFYLNGQSTDRKPNNRKIVNKSSPIFLGKSTYDSIPNRYLNGKIDEFRFYNRAFREEEIEVIYNHGFIND